MIRFSQYLIISVLLALNSLAVGDDWGTAAAEELRNRFLHSDFQTVTKQSDLPDILVEHFSGFGPNDIADFGEPYNPTDRLDGSLPGRQIVRAGIANTVSYVVLNQGGIGSYRFTILVGRVAESVVMCRYYFKSLPNEDVADVRTWFEEDEPLAEPECETAA
jgi:hypothetical protein